jgi:hypothetical protein
MLKLLCLALAVVRIASARVYCGEADAGCCNCVFEPLDDKCLFDVRTRWCNPGLRCDGRACFYPSVVDSGQPRCGGANEGCCEGVCTPGLLCASGTCLDPDGVMDSAPCGLDGSPCCGHYEDCDEDLLCVSKRCARA